jgi:hypothetical protein
MNICFYFKTNQQQKRFSSSAPAAVNVDTMRFDLQQTTVEKKFQVFVYYLNYGKFVDE